MKPVYLLIEDEAQEGPFTGLEIWRMIEARRITWETLYAVDGAEAWRPLAEIKQQVIDEVIPTRTAWQPQPQAESVPYDYTFGLVVIGVLFIGMVVWIRAGTYDANAQLANVIGILLGVAVAVALYFVPTWVARNRAHRNATAIFMLNLFLGWTFLGWVVALVWAVKKD